ncbi:MAG: zinc ribbon domain-containing protein, partial [Pirellulaceae bacterium]|nr:zinc ribbon domain-containing protein [Pirellulaceae bacterium]
MKCPECGSEVVESSVYCHKCGGRLDRQTWEDPASESPGDSAAGETTLAGQTASERFRGAIESTRAKNTGVEEEELWTGGYCGKAMMDAWVVSGLVTLALLIAAIVVWNK